MSPFISTADTTATQTVLVVSTTATISGGTADTVLRYLIDEFMGESMDRFHRSVHEFAGAVKRLPPRTPQPMPYGWRDPVAIFQPERRSPRAIFACTHRAARRDLRRRRRTRWLSELRT